MKTRFYKSVYDSNTIEILLVKTLSDEEWKIYSNKVLNTPFQVEIEIICKDLVGKKYKLKTKVIIKNLFII